MQRRCGYAAERQAWWTLWAQVLSRAVTECLSGSCSSREVMHWCTDCRKGLASAEKGGREPLPGPPLPSPARGLGASSHTPADSWTGDCPQGLVLYRPALSPGRNVSTNGVFPGPVLQMGPQEPHRDPWGCWDSLSPEPAVQHCRGVVGREPPLPVGLRGHLLRPPRKRAGGRGLVEERRVPAPQSPTVLPLPIDPQRALGGVVGRHAELQRWHAGEILVICNTRGHL